MALPDHPEDNSQKIGLKRGLWRNTLALQTKDAEDYHAAIAALDADLSGIADNLEKAYEGAFTDGTEFAVSFQRRIAAIRKQLAFLRGCVATNDEKSYDFALDAAATIKANEEGLRARLKTIKAASKRK